MTKVKWIKLTTDMFDNAKIKYIRSLPSGNDMVLIWVMLLTKAGKCNAGGFIMLTEKIPYTVEMLATEFGFDAKLVKLAFATFANLDMITINDDDIICIPGWSEHQNIEGLEKIREQGRARVQRYRERQKKLLKENKKNVDSNVDVTKDVTLSNVTVTHLDIDIDIEKDINNIYFFWNSCNIICHRSLTDKIKKSANKAIKEYGVKNVIEAIKRYDIILKDKLYYFEYKWSLDEFLRQKNTLPSFLDDGSKWNNYKTWKEQQENNTVKENKTSWADIDS